MGTKSPIVRILKPKKMYKLVALTVLVAVATAQLQQQQQQQHNQHQHQNHNPMFELIIHEVRALMNADSSLTSASCITKCDAAMEMDDPQDETRIDEMCKNVCNCEIDHNCQHQQQHQHTPPADAHTPPPSPHP